MTHSQPAHSPIIRWPTEHLPYRKTLRARKLRLSFFYVIWLVTAYCGFGLWFMGVPAMVFGASLDDPHPVLLGFVLVALAFAIFFVIQIRWRLWRGYTIHIAGRSVSQCGARHGRRLCEEWRRLWREFETQSNQFKSALIAQDHANATLAKAPWYPALRWALMSYSDTTVARIEVTPSHADDFDRAMLQEGLLLSMCASFAALGGESVIGLTRSYGNHLGVKVIFAVSSGVHFHATFQPIVTGNVIGCRVEHGYQMWFDKQYTINRHYYPGDLKCWRRLRRWEVVSNVLVGAFLTSLAMPYGYYLAIGECWSGNAARQILQKADPHCGDSSDLALLMEARGGAPAAFHNIQPTDEVTSAINALRQRILQSVTDAVRTSGRQLGARASVTWET